MNPAQGITQTTRFDYDALGRRIAKHDAFGSTQFIWEGMRLIEERRGSSVVTYLYEPDGYVPLARIDATGQQTEQGGLGTTHEAPPLTPVAEHTPPLLTPFVASPSNHERSNVAANDYAAHWEALNAPRSRDPKQAANSESTLANVYYFHTDQVGLPEELSDQHGQIRWRAAYKTWGNTISERWEAVNLAGETLGQRAERPEQDNAPLHIEQNLRFQGQYLDRDTGLHYNTFRFYDPDIGRFISPDPIGLSGGLNLHQYADNPNVWIDPLGWCATAASQRRAQTSGDATLPTARAARRAAMRDQNIPTSQSYKSTWKADGVDGSGGRMFVEEIKVGGRNTGGATKIGEIKAHPDGHSFPPTKQTPYPTHELPHYHGKTGQHISYENGTPRPTNRYGR
jgi:RHS repeat-associated protein